MLFKIYMIWTNFPFISDPALLTGSWVCLQTKIKWNLFPFYVICITAYLFMPFKQFDLCIHIKSLWNSKIKWIKIKYNLLFLSMCAKNHPDMVERVRINSRSDDRNKVYWKTSTLVLTRRFFSTAGMAVKNPRKCQKPRDEILERHFSSRSLGINFSDSSSCLVFYPHYSFIQKAFHK